MEFYLVDFGYFLFFIDFKSFLFFQLVIFIFCFIDTFFSIFWTLFSLQVLNFFFLFNFFVHLIYFCEMLSFHDFVFFASLSIMFFNLLLDLFNLK